MERSTKFCFLFATTVPFLLCASGFAQSDAVNTSDDYDWDLSYSFYTHNFPGDTFTQLLGINDEDKIAGYHGSGATGHPNKGFVLSLPSDFDAENFPKSVQTQVIGINDHRDTDGFYIDSAGTTHGFLHYDSTFKTVDFPGTTFNQLLGLNNHDQAAGYYADSAGIDHPYIYDNDGGVFLVITIPAAVGGAQATGINDRGSISGFYIDSATVNHGFLLEDGKFITLDFPESTFTQALGLNDRGEVVGSYMDTSGLTQGFVYHRGHFKSLDDPNGVGVTIVNGINNRRDIVGFYGNCVNGGTTCDGFVGKP